MWEVIWGKLVGWGVGKALDVPYNLGKGRFKKYQIQKALIKAQSCAVQQALKDYPELSEDVFTPTFRDGLLKPLLEALLDPTNLPDPEKLLKQFEERFVERWSHGKDEDTFKRLYGIRKNEAGVFTKTLFFQLETAFRQNKHLREFARDRSAFRTDDNVQKLVDRLLPSQENLPQITVAALDSAKSELERIKLSLKLPSKSVSLGIEINKDDKPQPIDREKISTLLDTRKIIIEAGPGCGKTTTLLQLGELALSSHKFIPIFLPLIRIATGKGIFEAIVARDAFNSGGEPAIRLLAQAGRIMLLCDGWNELSADRRSLASNELEQFNSEFPDCPLIITTRAQNDKPNLDNATIFYLSPLTRAQQLEIIKGELGDKGIRLWEHTRILPGLRDILRIPFYLRAIANIGSIDSPPETKTQIIAQFIDQHIRQPERNRIFQSVLAGKQENYLKRLACNLVEKNSTAVSDEELRVIFSDASLELKDKKLISIAPEPHTVIETLLAHHVLIQQGDREDALYSFQHQQFQEWYASFYAEQLIIDAAGGNTEAHSTLYSDIVNYAPWEESLLFAVERLSRTNSQGAAAVGKLIIRTLGIDPLLAATIISRSTVEVWEHVKKPVLAFIKEWHTDGKKDRALDFMVLAGRPEFSSHIWSVLDKCGENDRMLGLRRIGHFDSDTLGENAKQKLLNLKPRIRRALLWDIISEGGYKGIEFASDILKEEPDNDIFVEMLGALNFRGADTYVAELLDMASDAAWEKLAQHRGLEVLSHEPYKSRLLKEEQKLISTLPAGHQRILPMMHLDEAGITDYSDQLIAEVLETKFSDNHAEYHILKDLAQCYPQKLSQAIIQRTLRGNEVHYYAFEFLLPDMDVEQGALVQAVSNPSNKPSFDKAVAKLLNAESIEKILEELIATKESAKQLDRGQAKGLWDHYSNLKDILRNALSEKLAIAILRREATQPAPIAELAAILSSWGDTHSWQAKLELTPDTKSALIERAKEWAEIILTHPDSTRNNIASIGNLLGCLGAPQLLDPLRMLLDKELELYKKYKKIADETKGGWGNIPGSIKSEMQNGTPTNQLRLAFEGFNCPELPEILSRYLDEPGFRIEAAYALRHYFKLQSSGPAEEKFSHYPDYSQVAKKRSAVQSGAIPTEIDPTVAKILQCVGNLLQKEPKSPAHAAKLAIAAAQLNYGRRLDIFYAVLQSTAPVMDRVGLARILLQNGEAVPVDYLIPLIEETEKEVFEKNWGSNDDWYKIEEILELLAFTDQPNLIVERFLTYPERYRQPWRLRRVVGALGNSTSSEAVSTLKALQNIYPELVAHHKWYTSLGRLGSEKAAELLIELMFDAAKIPYLQKESWGIRGIFRKLMNSHSKIRKNLIERISAKDARIQRQFVASMTGIHEGIEEDLFLAIFESAEPTEKETFNLLANSLEGLATNKRLVEGSDNSYNLEPRDISVLRKALFAHATSNSPLAGAALGMLNKIDRVRDEYGRPPSEPRHPDISSGVPYPPAAQVVWN